MRKQLFRLWLLLAMLVSAPVFTGCSNDDNATEQTEVTTIADKVWAYAQDHPVGFTLNIRTMTAPTEGIAVAYADTQDSFDRGMLDFVVKHSLEHDGYVGGWYNSDDGRFYFDSTRIFPENQLEEAIKFGKENGQYAIFILSTGTEVSLLD